MFLTLFITAIKDYSCRSRVILKRVFVFAVSIANHDVRKFLAFDSKYWAIQHIIIENRIFQTDCPSCRAKPVTKITRLVSIPDLLFKTVFEFNIYNLQ